MGFDFFMVNRPEQAVGYEPEMPDRPDWVRVSVRGIEALFNGMSLARVLEGKTPKPVLPVRDERNEAEFQSRLATPSSIGNAVPYWKFSDNSGSLVSPAECEIVASGLERRLNEEPQTLRPKDWPESQPLDGYLALLREWAAFNRLASSHGGYRVR